MDSKSISRLPRLRAAGIESRGRGSEKSVPDKKFWPGANKASTVGTLPAESTSSEVVRYGTGDLFSTPSGDRAAARAFGGTSPAILGKAIRARDCTS